MYLASAFPAARAPSGVHSGCVASHRAKTEVVTRRAGPLRSPGAFGVLDVAGAGRAISARWSPSPTGTTRSPFHDEQPGVHDVGAPAVAQPTSASAQGP